VSDAAQDANRPNGLLANGLTGAFGRRKNHVLLDISKNILQEVAKWKTKYAISGLRFA
jgi:hypothetical protein